MRAIKKPAYLQHKATGQSRVRVKGKDIYLGTFGTPDSYARYEEVLREWSREQSFDKCLVTVDELVLK